MTVATQMTVKTTGTHSVLKSCGGFWRFFLLDSTDGPPLLMAIIDWASRLMLSWRLSNTMDTTFCMDALHEAIDRYGTPEIFNSDQGSQFTSEEFVLFLTESRSAWMGKADGLTTSLLKGYGKVSNMKKSTWRPPHPAWPTAFSRAWSALPRWQDKWERYDHPVFHRLVVLFGSPIRWQSASPLDRALRGRPVGVSRR